jgi:hypothetical protein
MATRLPSLVDPDLIAFVRALARADAEDDVARRLAKRRGEGRKAA